MMSLSTIEAWETVHPSYTQQHLKAALHQNNETVGERAWITDELLFGIIVRVQNRLMDLYSAVKREI